MEWFCGVVLWGGFCGVVLWSGFMVDSCVCVYVFVEWFCGRFMVDSCVCVCMCVFLWSGFVAVSWSVHDVCMCVFVEWFCGGFMVGSCVCVCGLWWFCGGFWWSCGEKLSWLWVDEVLRVQISFYIGINNELYHQSLVGVALGCNGFVVWFRGLSAVWFCGVVLWCGFVVCGFVVWFCCVVLLCGSVAWFCCVVLWCDGFMLWFCGASGSFCCVRFSRHWLLGAGVYPDPEATSTSSSPWP